MVLNRLEGKVAVITGASSGIGAGQAKVLASEKAKVVCCGRNEERLNQTIDAIRAEGGEAIGMVADVSKYEDCLALAKLALDTYGKIDILCNTAGVHDAFCKTTEQTPEGWDAMFSVDVKGVFQMTKAVLSHMIEQGSGSIINISSIAGIGATDGGAAYTASKHAVNGYTKQLCIDHAAQGIRANSICVGMCSTPMVEEIFEKDPRERQKVMIFQPCKFLGKPEDVAYLTVYLASDESKWMNGSVIALDGGRSAMN